MPRTYRITYSGPADTRDVLRDAFANLLPLCTDDFAMHRFHASNPAEAAEMAYTTVNDDQVLNRFVLLQALIAEGFWVEDGCDPAFPCEECRREQFEAAVERAEHLGAERAL